MIRYTSFNQDSSCLVVSLSNGCVRVYHTSTHECCYARQYRGCYGIVEMLFKTSLFVKVGSGEWDTTGNGADLGRVMHLQDTSMSPRRLQVVNTNTETDIAR